MTAARYGTWNSPVGADLITQKTINITEVHVDPVTNKTYHAESRPSESGRTVVVETATDKDVFGTDWNARSSVQEYGGASFAVRDGQIFFTDFKTKRIYLVKEDGSAEPVTPEKPDHRFGDFVIHPVHTHLLVSILEDHTIDEPSKVVNTLAVIDTKAQTVTNIAKGADFYNAPRFSPDGTKISWFQWYHPDMPWEGSELVVGDFSVENGKASVVDPKVVAGKKGEESISQSFWYSNDTVLYFTDKSGFYNPSRYNVVTSTHSEILSVPIEEDFSEPAWLFGWSFWASLGNGDLLVAPLKNGVAHLALLNVASGKLTDLKSPYVTIHDIHVISSTEALIVAEEDSFPNALISVTLNGTADASFKILKATSSAQDSVPSGIFPKSEAIVLPDPETGAPLHVLYFPPTNPDYTGGIDGELPPAIINMHGGPTSRVAPGLNWKTTFFTSKGYAWVDVNYGGSSGYGRAYRERLRGKWGIVDLDDAVTAVKRLGEKGKIDSQRAAIRGGSAGGYSVLAALVKHPKAFAVGNSLYGISDLTLLAQHTHKFESQYLFKLIGGTPEEVPEVYKERSPLFSAEKIEAPLLVQQGSADFVVPPAQSEAIVDKIKEKGGKVDYILFEGEGHGFRKAENIKTSLEREDGWYKEVFGLI